MLFRQAITPLIKTHNSHVWGMSKHQICIYRHLWVPELLHQPRSYEGQAVMPAAPM